MDVARGVIPLDGNHSLLCTWQRGSVVSAVVLYMYSMPKYSIVDHDVSL